jgi:hypothetical protein
MHCDGDCRVAAFLAMTGKPEPPAFTRLPCGGPDNASADAAVRGLWRVILDQGWGWRHRKQVRYRASPSAHGVSRRKSYWRFAPKLLPRSAIWLRHETPCALDETLCPPECVLSNVGAPNVAQNRSHASHARRQVPPHLRQQFLRRRQVQRDNRIQRPRAPRHSRRQRPRAAMPAQASRHSATQCPGRYRRGASAAGNCPATCGTA